MTKENFEFWYRHASVEEQNFITFDEKTEEVIGWDECQFEEVGRAKTIKDINEQLNRYALTLGNEKEGEWFLYGSNIRSSLWP